MADVIQLSDGSVHTLFDERDALDLIDCCMGMEMRRWLENWMSEGDDDAAYIEDLERKPKGSEFTTRRSWLNFGSSRKSSPG